MVICAETESTTSMMYPFEGGDERNIYQSISNNLSVFACFCAFLKMIQVRVKIFRIFKVRKIDESWVSIYCLQ